MRNVIQTLWVGPELSTLERLCLRSFLAHGHEVHLYSYGEVQGVPPGVAMGDGREILPEAAVFRYRDGGSYSGFSNFFRYKLLLERGGWWVDSDVICLTPFDLPGEHVFASELLRTGPVPATAVIKAPAGSEVMARAWEVCQSKDPGALEWGETGPQLLRAVLDELGLATVPPEVFCPIPYDRWDGVLDPGLSWEPGEATRAVHLWNDMWSRAGRSKDGSYPAGCLYERLKARYLSAAERRQV